jgi:anti-sigma28 factor (negative regulator of flagellin synthesis)
MGDSGRPPQPPPDPEELEALYSPEYLRECASGEAREERLSELRRRIACGAYRVDPDSLAAEILRRGTLAD